MRFFKKGVNYNLYIKRGNIKNFWLESVLSERYNNLFEIDSFMLGGQIFVLSFS